MYSGQTSFWSNYTILCRVRFNSKMTKLNAQPIIWIQKYYCTVVVHVMLTSREFYVVFIVAVIVVNELSTYYDGNFRLMYIFISSSTGRKHFFNVYVIQGTIHCLVPRATVCTLFTKCIILFAITSLTQKIKSW